MNREQTMCPGVMGQCPVPLAMAYVPMQQFDATYSPERALARGTLFQELDKPFCGRTIAGGDRRG